MFYINKETLEVVEWGYAYTPSDSEKEVYIEYPYDEYDPEKEYLRCSDGSFDLGDQIDHIIHPSKTIQEITDDFKSIESKYASANEQYDYISFEVNTMEECDEEFTMIQPVGVYRPTKERALAWYKEQCEVKQKNKKAQFESLNRIIKSKQQELELAQKHLKELGYTGEI